MLGILLPSGLKYFTIKKIQNFENSTTLYTISFNGRDFLISGDKEIYLKRSTPGQGGKDSKVSLEIKTFSPEFLVFKFRTKVVPE